MNRSFTDLEKIEKAVVIAILVGMALFAFVNIRINLVEQRVEQLEQQR